MANKALFPSRAAPNPATTVNEAGGRAYQLPAKQALAQLAATGTLARAYYAGPEEQLDQLLALADEVPVEFLAKTAVYTRQRGYMKDTPALLTAVLSRRDSALFERVFPTVVDDGRMLRTFAQIMRSGTTGRRSFGSAPKRAMRQWFNSRTERQILSASIGTTPSLADIIKMVHPKPQDAERHALYRYLLGKSLSSEQQAALPPFLRDYEQYKREPSGELPHVPFQMLTALPLDTTGWAAIAQRATWQQLRQNLNTFARHGVYEQPGMVELVAQKLADPEAIAGAKVFPYQVLATWASATVPEPIRTALATAMDIAIANVPILDASIVVCPDVSGSMHSPVTGRRGTATTAVQCNHVAALVAATVLRRNPNARIIPFDDKTYTVGTVAAEEGSILALTERMAHFGGGGTDCSAPLRQLNQEGATADLVILVSDNQSWIGQQDAAPVGAASVTMFGQTYYRNMYNVPTTLLQEWRRFRARNPAAKLICIDLQPYQTVQAPDDDSILNVGGWSDAVWDVARVFLNGALTPDHWVSIIEGSVLV